ncbi:HET-domain-containing protein [Glonium stellatum]|uniref:HET-domain-containing protein n=1 Tax=Glonium stellatum TaxID=574774 RepID=A0A8E2JTH2_9PEZI|nr:HET-domain-containing protein [Glonium stellatum]
MAGIVEYTRETYRQLRDGVFETELCIPCKRAVLDDDLSRIGGPLWLNDGFPDCKGKEKPILYCCLCKYILRARALAARAGKRQDIQSKELDWVMLSMDQGVLMCEDGLMKEIEEGHGATCNSQEAGTVDYQNARLLLIDVKKECIVEASFEYRYLALSYVWGKVEQFKTKKANFALLKRPNGLSSAPITRTIKDAMMLVAGLGESYLWVDTLCIVQDDEEGKQEQILQMAAIYSKAILTIVAVAGSDANSGLPGVYPTVRNERSIAVAPGLQIVERTSLAEGFGKFIYNTRAWTFQERVLSSRCLFFFNELVYFQCKKNIWCEDRYGDDSAAWPSSLFTLEKAQAWSRNQHSRGKYNDMDDFRFYALFVAEYSQKKMGYPSDIINAFTGITDALDKLYKWKFGAGLPLPMLDLALLWTPLETATRRDTKSDVIFPSWSWVGWVGSAHYGDLVQRIPQIPIRESYKSCIMIKYQPNSSPGLADLLQFSTQIVAMKEFRLNKFGGRLQNQEYNVLVCQDVHMIFAKNGRRCGIIYGLRGENLQYGSSDALQLLLISTVSRASSLSTYGPLISRFNDGGYTTDEALFENYVDKEWCTLNVILAESYRDHVRRVAVGQIHREAWVEANPVDQMVALG